MTKTRTTFFRQHTIEVSILAGKEEKISSKNAAVTVQNFIVTSVLNWLPTLVQLCSECSVERDVSVFDMVEDGLVFKSISKPSRRI